jgi:hypothetical protein
MNENAECLPTPSLGDKIVWTPWRPLLGGWLDRSLPSGPGLYRIRRSGRDDVDYIGQTSLRLRDRLGMLRGVFGAEMPYRDPHTVGPALWAIRHATQCDFEASVAGIEGDTPWRKAMECVAIALYRQEHGRSPTFNFGRMPSGYRMSSGNNSRLVQAGLRFRGGPHDDTLPSHEPGIAPVGTLDGDPTASDWCGHSWSPWRSINQAVSVLGLRASGLYRLRAQDAQTMLYIGEGRVRHRLVAHYRKLAGPEQRQGDIFRSAGAFEASCVLNDHWLGHQRLELETDLIAAHVLSTGTVPPAQFLG